MLRRALAAAILTLGAIPPAAAIPDAPANSVRLRTVGGVLIVRVAMDGAGTHDFVLDTAATMTVVDTPLARAAGVPLARSVRRTSTTGTRDAELFRIRSLRVGGAAVAGLDVVVESLDGIRAIAPSVAGVLGHDVVGRWSWLLDVRRRVLFLDGERLHMTGGTRAPFSLAQGRPMIEVSLDGEPPRRLVVDSAANAVALFQHSREPGGGVRRVNGLDGAASVFARTGVRIAVAGRRAARPVATVSTGPRDGVEDGVMPTSVFNVWFFDRSAGHFLIEPSYRE